MTNWLNALKATLRIRFPNGINRVQGTSTMKNFSLLLVLLFLSACTPPDSASGAQDLDARLARIENGLTPGFQIKGQDQLVFNIDERLKELGIPGMSVAFVANGEIAWQRAYGMADIGEDKPMQTCTMLLAGSISKPVAALRAHQLVEAGVFNLDENINSYLTSWQVPDNEFTETEKVTIRRILNHTAGLTVWGFPGYDDGDEVPGVVGVLDGLGNTDPVRVFKQPGESWLYSGGGYTIMQLAITEQEGMTFPETMQRNVLDRINMSGSTYENPLPAKYHSLAATGYRSNGGEVEGKWPIYPEMAAAGLWTTPGELIQYAIEVQKIFQTRQDGLLKYETVAEMLTPGMNDHGLGPGVDEHTFGHGGADEGFRAQLIAWKEKPYAVVVMVNSDNGSIMQELLQSIASEYELPGIDPLIREILEIPSEELMKFVGRYELENIGLLEIQLSGDGLVVQGEALDETIKLLSQSETELFDSTDGTLFEFDISEGVVTGFDVRGLRGVPVD